jgi:deoxyribodipyrimidine photo-lyase
MVRTDPSGYRLNGMENGCLYWLKRDFRLLDNPALTAALTEFDQVAPIFILEPSALAAPETSAFHVHAQCDAFNGLHRLVGADRGRIGFVHGEVVTALDRIFSLQPFSTLVSHMEVGRNRTYDRDRAVAHWCRKTGVEWREYRQTAIIWGKLDRDRRQRDWKGFMEQPPLPLPDDLSRLQIPPAYRRVVEVFDVPERLAPASAPNLPTKFASDKWVPRPELLGTTVSGPLDYRRFGHHLADEQTRYVQPVNTQAAEVTLASFHTARAIHYSKGMSSPNTAFYNCSRLSVHLAWGTMSVRTAYRRTQDRMEELRGRKDEWSKTLARNLRSFLSRLHWHDHFTQRLETEVEMEHRPLNPNFWELELEDSPELLTAWLDGTTGWPMADACLRCMATTGYLNFRMRAMLTSVAAHVLHLDFRSIDKPMARRYTDYEPGIHLAQLQMQAGLVGINTLRTYSPDKQLLDHDPQAEFVHRWVPELRPFSPTEIKRRDPWQPLGAYPAVRVDRIPRAKQYKTWLGDLKYRPGGREITERVMEKHGSRKSPAARGKRRGTG